MATFTFTDGTEASGTATPLSVGYSALQVAVAYCLRLTTNMSASEVAALSAADKADIDAIIQAGYRQFLWPPPIPMPTPPDNVVVHKSASQAKQEQGRHRWTFLEPATTLALVNGTYAYTLPSDFGGALNSVTYEGSVANDPLGAVPDEHLRSLRSNDPKSGDPDYYAIRPVATDGSAVQRWEVLFYPTPNASRNLLCRYSVAPGALSAANPYPYGGPAHSETLVESCLAVAEERKADKSSAHRERFLTLLAASIAYDLNMAGETSIETWPSGDTGAADLNVTYGILLKRVGHELGLSWNATSWPTEDRRKVDMIIHQGLRQFYNPPPLRGEKYAHEWSFLTPIAELTTTAPYGTGTVTIVDGVVTLAGGTWPAWAAAGTFTGAGTTAVAVATRDSGTQLTLADLTVDAAAGSSYSLLPSAAYTLPTDFASMAGPLTFEPGANVLHHPIDIVSENYVRARLAEYTFSGRPEVAAIRPKAVDQTVATKYEIVFCPVPDAAYLLTYRYHLNMAALGSTSIYPPGGQPHAETILESCLAAYERFNGTKDGVHAALFAERLAASVSADQKAAAPDFLGYNGDGSDVYYGDPYVFRHRWSDNLVTYNGQTY